MGVRESTTALKPLQLCMIVIHITCRDTLDRFLPVGDPAGHVLSRHSRMDPIGKKSMFLHASPERLRAPQQPNWGQNVGLYCDPVNDR